MMKIWNVLFAGVLAAGMAVSCTDENPAGENPTPGADDTRALYMNVSVALPAPTRSETGDEGGSSDGSEVGKDYENSVKKLLLVLTKTDDSYVTYGVVEGLSTPAGKSTITTTAKFNRTDIQRFYDADGNLLGSNLIHVYTFCNPTTELLDYVTGLSSTDGAKWYEKVCRLTETVGAKPAPSIWTKDAFLMANAKVAEKKIPATFKEWTVNYASETSPFDLSGDNNGGIDNRGAIAVERAMARFDFRDGSKGDNTYDIGLGEDEGKLSVKLVRMALVNMSNEFYYLRRVSDNGLNTGSTLCGLETSYNYVVDTDADFKRAVDLKDVATIASLKDHFNFRLYDDEGMINDETRRQWDSYWIDDVLNPDRDEDNDEGWTPGTTGYRIWRYVVENTVPKDDTKQKTGITTGVVFKGKLLVGDKLETDSKLRDAIGGVYTAPEEGAYTYEVEGKIYPILYTFQNKIYVGWNDEVRAQALAEEEEQSSFYTAAMTANANGNPDELYQALVAAKGTADERDALDAFRKAATTAGFTLYQASNDATGVTGDNAGVGYYFYYYYWNRHNDNGYPGTMGPMEFAVVRNNVYKLAVTKINKLGHPRIPGNDPDPVDPEDPDESGDIYLRVSVEVLPWVVRVNDIEF